MTRRALAVLAATLCGSSITALGQDATVTVGSFLRDSQLSLGVTHTQAGLDKSGFNATAAARGKLLLSNSQAIEATQTIGWGVSDINPSKGVYNWSTLNTRVNLMNSIDPSAEQVMTLCTAPGWMKPDLNTFNMEEAPSVDHFQDYADLAVQISIHCPQVRTFQIWNEFKGFYDSPNSKWNAALYTQFYNTVYTALKAHDSTLQVGGFYLPVSGTGSLRSGTNTYKPFNSKDLTVLNYWLTNNVGADFIDIDRGIVDYHDTSNTYTIDDRLALTPFFGSVVDQIKAKTDLPVRYAEYYGTGGTEQQRGVGFASIYGYMIRSGVDQALLWNPNEGETSAYLFTDVADSTGGTPTDHYRAWRTVQEYFGKGKAIYGATSTATTVESIVSKDRMMLINKGSAASNVVVGSKTYKLGAYDFQTYRRNDLTRTSLPLSDDFTDGDMTTGVHWYKNAGNMSGNWKFPASGSPFGTGTVLQFNPGSDQQDHSVVAALPNSVSVTATSGVRLHLDYQDASTGGIMNNLRIGLFKGAAVTADGYPKFGDTGSVIDPTQDWSGYVGQLSMLGGGYSLINRDESTSSTTDSPFYNNTQLGQDINNLTRTGLARSAELVVYRDADLNLVVELWDGAYGEPLSLVTFGIDSSAASVLSFSNIGLLMDNGAAVAGQYGIFNFDNIYVDTFATGVPEPTTGALVLMTSGALLCRRGRHAPSRTV